MSKVDDYHSARLRCLRLAEGVPDQSLRQTWRDVAESYCLLAQLEEELQRSPLIGARCAGE